MMSLLRHAAFILTFFSFQMPMAQAAIIYDNGVPTTDNGYPIWGTINGTGSTTADDFTLASNGAITGVGFYFQNYTGITGWSGLISYAIRSDASGMPGGILASGSGLNVVSSLSSYPWCCGGGNAWLVEFDLQSTFNAVSGTTYWLELGGADGPTPWWVTTGPGNAKHLRNGTVYSSWANDVSFYLTGSAGPMSVPEPATFALFGLGLAGFGWSRYKKAQAKKCSD